MMDLTMKNLAVQSVYVTLLLVIINSHRPVDTAYMSAVAIRNLFVNNTDHMQLAQASTLLHIVKLTLFLVPKWF